MDIMPPNFKPVQISVLVDFPVKQEQITATTNRVTASTQIFPETWNFHRSEQITATATRLTAMNEIWR